MFDNEKKDYYEYWNEHTVYKRFNNKGLDDFFKSEICFLDKIMPSVNIVLDIGCASGRLIELLHTYQSNISYTGIDISSKFIEQAQEQYPGYDFVYINALDYKSNKKFDLVISTGVCQHEPGFIQLINRMVDLSNRFILFDVKFSNVREHLINIEESYSGLENRTYFILLNYEQFKEYLKSNNKIKNVNIYGYETQKNDHTIVPENINQIISAGVLLEVDQGCNMGQSWDVDLPFNLLH
jgi:SAM-dependent methyltransferase